MLNPNDIEFEIEILKSGEGNQNTYEELANLLIVRDELKKDEKGGGRSKQSKGSDSGNEKIDKETAEEWGKELENSDGTRGAHWNIDQSNLILSKRGLTFDPYQFYLSLNFVYSLLYKALKKQGVNSLDAYIDIAKALFLDDKENTEKKLSAFHEN